MIYVLDTHAWLWWLDKPETLSGAVRRILGEVSEDRPVMVSSISVWELYMLVEKKRLVLNTDAAHWIRQSERSRRIRFIPVDNEISRIATQLPRDFPADPADRFIAASAISLGAVLITKDDKIRSSSAIRTVW